MRRFAVRLSPSAFGLGKEVISWPYKMIETEDHLADVAAQLSQGNACALDIEAFCPVGPAIHEKQLGTISLIQLCSPTVPAVFMVDVISIGVDAAVRRLDPLLRNENVKKLMFDCRRDVEALSFQMKLEPTAVLDLQLLHAMLQWKSRGVNRRSGLGYVLKNTLALERQPGDQAVQQAMTVGNRPVWDVRPLPPHFLEYAADDARHILLLADRMVAEEPKAVEATERLSAEYVRHYAAGKPVEREVDPKPNEVYVPWLEQFAGPAGACAFCGQRGHTEAECFKKNNGQVKCSYCGELGHTAKNCYKKHPDRLKCAHCGQLGHTEDRCFVKNSCAHCGGAHLTEHCHKAQRERQRQRRKQAGGDARHR